MLLRTVRNWSSKAKSLRNWNCDDDCAEAAAIAVAAEQPDVDDDQQEMGVHSSTATAARDGYRLVGRSSTPDRTAAALCNVVAATLLL